jgi:hypothetical protein
MTDIVQNPQTEVNEEQTCCLLSFLLFSFLDPIIYYGWKHPRVPYEKFPTLCDYDRTDYLSDRSFAASDSECGWPLWC